MPSVEQIVKEIGKAPGEDVLTPYGFERAMKEMRSIPYSELWWVIAQKPFKSGHPWLQQFALAKAEFERRSFAQQE